MLSRDAILGADDARVTTVSVPEWGGSVCIRALSLADQQELEARLDSGDKTSLLLNMVAIALCDEQGVRLFHGDAIDALKAKSASAMLRISRSVMKLAKLTPKDVDEIVKNAEAAPSDVTSSPSPNG